MLLIKHSPSYQVSHLYRLLYRKSIDDFFHSKGLYRSLDYLIYGTTYYKGGIIAIEINLITEEAKKHTEEIKNLEITIDTTTVGVGFLQLLAEQKRIIAATAGLDGIKEALADLHKQPWQDIDNLEMRDVRNTDTKGGALILQKGTAPRLRTLTVNFSLSQAITNKQPELTPLFEHLVGFFYKNNWTAISMKYGLFSEGMKKPLNKHGEFTIPFSFKCHPQAHDAINQQKTLNEIGFDFFALVHRCHTDKAIHRFMDNLRNSTYDTDTLKLMPGPSLVTDTGFLIGTQGWRKIATMENCKLLLENTFITVKYSHKHIRQHL